MNMKIRLYGRFRTISILVAVLLALVLPQPVLSQGCALCYTQAANSGARIIQALRNGIVILIIPPVSMCLGAMVLAYRKRNQFTRPKTHVESGSDW